MPDDGIGHIEAAAELRDGMRTRIGELEAENARLKESNAGLLAACERMRMMLVYPNGQTAQFADQEIAKAKGTS